MPRWTSGSVHLGSSADAWASIESACAKARAAPLGSGTIRASACRRLRLGALHQHPRLWTGGPLPLVAQAHLRAQALTQEHRGPLRQRVAEQQVLGGRLLEARPLELGVARGVDEPHGHAHAILVLLHASLDQGADLERTRDAVAWHAGSPR